YPHVWTNSAKKFAGSEEITRDISRFVPIRESGMAALRPDRFAIAWNLDETPTEARSGRSQAKQRLRLGPIQQDFGRRGKGASGRPPRRWPGCNTPWLSRHR